MFMGVFTMLMSKCSKPKRPEIPAFLFLKFTNIYKIYNQNNNLKKGDVND